MKRLSVQQLKERIFNNSFQEPNTGCWLWGDSVNFFGYGILKASALDKKIVTAHRASYWLQHGKFNLSLHVLHRCDTPSCVNPDHLFLGTHQENMDDRKRKNRTNRVAPKGENCGASKLTESDVIKIRSLYPTFTQQAIAEKFGVKQTTIYYILNRKSWKHI